ncbi:ATP-dependent DNA helicase [Candidatus Woesearchaeota archaeon]|nr:ATP-dependent DNA helicase [Candidatus Woesearchaeota archaeon]
MAYIFRNINNDKPKNKSLFEFTSANELEKENDEDNSRISSEIKFEEEIMREKIEETKKFDKETPQEIKGILFPYEKIRDEQETLIESANDAIMNSKHLVAHAPTGLGKTVSVIAPALSYAINNNKQVLFLTSRHTQHLIAMKTAKDIHEKFNIDFIATDIIGKKWMCINSAAKNANSKDFAEICKYLRENNSCKYYANTRKNGSIKAEVEILMEDKHIKKKINATEDLIKFATENELCPYEISLALAKESKLIITDYYYAFNENVMDNFFRRAQIMLEDCILIVDEGHNLPQRIRDQQTSRLTTNMINRAIKESQKIHNEEIEEELKTLNKILEDWGEELNEQKNLDNFQNQTTSEALIRKEDFEIEISAKRFKYDEFAKRLLNIGEGYKEYNNTMSYIYLIGLFLENWKKITDESYIRILQKEPKNTLLTIRCLDPSVTSKKIIATSHSTILMSGTLQPTQMYADVLGFDDERTEQKIFKNPFPKKNRLNLIIPKTTTKYQARTSEQYKNIAKICTDLVNNIPGNSIVFFPSYDILKKTYVEMTTTTKTMIAEHKEMSREEKIEILEKFKEYHKTGACLLAVQSGSFSEGIDLPGDYLKGVIIVGLPLQKPDLETRQLINYYDMKFNRGWDYGYVFPAFSKILQSAGRCIRSAEDKGLIAFLDERYKWPNYIRCFPEDWNLEISENHIIEAQDFFKQHK